MWVLLIILKIILYLFLAILLLFITLLIVPFTYRGEAAVIEGVSYSYRIGWFWNFFNIRGSKRDESETTEVYLLNKRLFTIDTKKKLEEKLDIEEEKDEILKESKAENNLKSMFEVKFIKEAFEYLKKIIKQILPKHLHLKGVYGFEDPSITGMTAGFIYTLQALVPQNKVQLQPCFAYEVFELEAEAEGKVVVGKIAYDTIKFILKPEIRKKIFRKSKKVKPKTK